jgi:hypothetical protein
MRRIKTGRMGGEDKKAREDGTHIIGVSGFQKSTL